MDGEGHLITTESVLLNSNRNGFPGMTKVGDRTDLQPPARHREDYLAAGDPDHVTGDMTDGRGRGSAPSAAPVTCWWTLPWTGTPPWTFMAAWCGRIAEPWPLATDARGRSGVPELFEASEAVDAEAEVFCASHTNFYIANGAIIMPAWAA